MQQILLNKTKRDFHSIMYYMDGLRKESIRTDHPQQRKSEQWPNEYRDGLIATVLKKEDIPYIVICEQMTEQGVYNYLIDGIQRVTTIYNYLKGVFRIGSRIENPYIEYMVNVLDKSGKPAKDDEGNLVYNIEVCDIRGKGYKDLPKELQNNFNEYQLMEVKYLNCSDDQIGYHLRRYNHAKKMGVSQNGMTYLDKKIAVQVKEITTTHTFFKDLGNFKPAERNNDTLNRIVLESIMATYFMDNWKGSLKDICLYLNENMNDTMILSFKNELDSISKAMTKSVAEMFTAKNSFLWFATYHKFCKTGLNTKKFVYFMEVFKRTLHCENWKGSTFDKMNEVSTKKKSCIFEKLQLLESFMYDFLGVNGKDWQETDALEFVKQNVNPDVVQEDIRCYEEELELLSLNVDNSTKLLDNNNRLSVLAIIAYSYEEDIIIDDWFTDFFCRNNTYICNQRENYLYMKKDLDKFMRMSCDV